MKGVQKGDKRDIPNQNWMLQNRITTESVRYSGMESETVGTGLSHNQNRVIESSHNKRE